MGIVNTYYIANGNTGDLASWPGQYFDFDLPSKEMDVWEGHLWDGNDHLIIGGGGVYGKDDKEWGVFTGKGTGKKIVWGAGHNMHDCEFDGYPLWFEDCDLIGVRDYPPDRNNVAPGCKLYELCL